MEASGTGEVFLADQAMLIHVIRLNNDSLTANGRNILAFENGIESACAPTFRPSR
jgi:uncharacterized protein (AIM24 family)